MYIYLGLPQVSKVSPVFTWLRGQKESPELLEGFLPSAELVKFLKPSKEDQRLSGQTAHTLGVPVFPCDGYYELIIHFQFTAKLL